MTVPYSLFGDGGKSVTVPYSLFLPYSVPYSYSKRVRVAFDTVEWDCGVDLDPEFVYAKCSMSTRA